MRWRIDLRYDGTEFHGWARQDGLRTVQGALEEALGTVLRLPDRPAVTCAGRTDTGVHARGQVTHVDLDVPVTGRDLLRRLNGVLPDDVAVTAVAEAADGFDARFSALARRYVYRLCDDAVGWDPLRRREVLRVVRPLDVDRMNAAAAQLLGEHDFAAFCKKREGASTVRALLEYSWVRVGPGLLDGTVIADAFCHSMVRALVGALIPVGDGRRDVDWPAAVLAGKMRDSAVAVLPAHGLTLEEVRYPADEDLAARALLARQVRGEVHRRG
ncbi:tRNA pseudouridine synthase A [Kribbella flavida DSM 17836]|uniref:tRNA pseudouridine synthase A n=1 Tax=Kribbella flavida (strain DSM 17836 / JCM 10339 / NBRC 14399) TaxID=479435 RepID=D2PU50_KRIFD|nr:tRNA pseudouridine(38-40) synthase TruA [Kribbella flavida]ADB35101.1 tRNA pseudouridine synthase A [Kribbella flavida DSM 17836]